MDRVQIFDTTLRDGEQSPGATMNVEEKLVIARQLEKLGVDVIEAGFAASSEGDFEAVRRVAERGHAAGRAVACAHARAGHRRARIKASRRPKRPGIHIFIATSDIHLKHKLMMSRQEVSTPRCWAVDAAPRSTSTTSSSPPRTRRAATPTTWSQVFAAVIEAGAATINVPDTTGYAMPEEYGALFRDLIASTSGRATA